MTFYLVYRAPRNNKNRGIVPHELRSLGCIQLHKSLWKIQEDEVKRALQILQKYEPILLRRTREIRKPEWNRKGEVTDIGSLSIVAYNIPNGKRKLVNRILLKMPCIRLCRSVYAFPQEHNLLDKNKIVDTLLNLIQTNNGDARFIPRMAIEDSDSIQKVVNEIEERIKQEALEIITISENLSMRVKNGDGLQKSSEKIANLRQKYSSLKKLANEYEKWLKLDFSKNLLKTYRAIKKAKDVIEQN